MNTWFYAKELYAYNSTNNVRFKPTSNFRNGYLVHRCFKHLGLRHRTISCIVARHPPNRLFWILILG